MKQLIPVLGLLLVFGGYVGSAKTAEAACSYNGFINSGGKCAKSYKNFNTYRWERDNENDDDYRRPFSYDRTDSINIYIEFLRDLIAKLEAQRDETTYEFDVATRSAINIKDDQATVRARLDFGDEDELTVWFQYGLSSGSLTRATSKQTIADDEDEDTERTIVNLDDNRRYYFRAVVENGDNDREYGSILSFVTDESDQNDHPDVTTGDVDDVTDDSAELNGEVDMNDFNNGDVFFVYGESEEQVMDVEDDYDSYSDVDEDGDNLQKVLVDPDLDSTDTYREVVTGLDADTRIYFSICVGYEDEDNDDVIKCGDVETFRTDE